MSHDIAPLMKPFFTTYLPVQRGLAHNTILAYRDAIKLLLCYASDSCAKHIDMLTVEDVDEQCVLGFLQYIEDKRGCCPRTRNARLAAIRALFSFIGRQEPELLLQCQRIRTIPPKRATHKMIEYLDEKELQALFNGIDVNSRTGLRDKALLLMLYNTGGRVSEIVGLKTADLRLDEQGQVKLLGKGRKQRSCPLWPETVDAVKQYLEHREKAENTDEQLFLNANGKPITRFGVRYIVKKYGAMAETSCISMKGKTITCHSIRHTTAMHLLRAGNDVNMVSFWLGHADSNTTHAYIEIDMEMKRKMLQKTAPPLLEESKPWQEPEILKWLDDLTHAPGLCAVL